MMLDIQNLCFYRTQKNNNKLIIDNISLSLSPNKIHAFVGPNGSGKTTLVNLIAGYNMPSSGAIFTNKKAIQGPDPNRVVINQEFDLFDWLTIEENLKLISKEKSLIEHYVSLFGLEKYLKYYPKQLSGGLKKRVSIARGLIGKPDIVMLDEAFASLDSITQGELLKEILRVKENINSCIILITHDIREVLYLSDNIYILSGPPLRLTEIFENPIPRVQRESILTITGLSLVPEKIKHIISEMLHYSAIRTENGNP